MLDVPPPTPEDMGRDLAGVYDAIRMVVARGAVGTLAFFAEFAIRRAIAAEADNAALRAIIRDLADLHTEREAMLLKVAVELGLCKRHIRETAEAKER